MAILNPFTSIFSILNPPLIINNLYSSLINNI
nr:MAG TPA: hypothetical protein [Caudoviricetes sp.]